MPDLLFLSHRIPYPPDKGDKIRSWNMLAHLAKRHRVHLGSLIDDPHDRRHMAKLREICAECFVAELDRFAAKLRCLPGLITGDPLTLGYFHHAALARWVADLIARRRPTLAFVYSSGMAPYVMRTRHGFARRVIDMVDIDSDKWRQYAARKAWPMRAVYDREGRTLLDFERRVARDFDASLFVSHREAELFRRLAPESAGKVFHVNNGVDLDYFSPRRAYDNPFPPGAAPIVFTGAMDYWPNMDAVTWFAQEIRPALLAAGLDHRFYIVGSNPATDVARLGQAPGVTVTGRVPDVRPYLAHAAAVVAPLRVARGVQNKVLEAMAMAKIVVCTPQALEGIEAEPDRHLRVAADPAGFAGAVVRAVRDDDNATIGRQARLHVETRYAWADNLARLDAVLEDRPASAAAAPAISAVG
ncbi:MAG: TIGR03087 family PEP-CTERM/XrtA system glycosyltransferase [Proteobacteria bacterium]|nr:TIGR03087 family PEP-CTERM/XrtA system glycosyltransferase [Pseudomonadota bacterium]